MPSKVQTAPLAFAPKQASGQEPLAGAQALAMNVFMDKAGAIRKRPGIRFRDDMPVTVVDPNGLTGIHQTLNGDVYCVGAVGAERPIYRINGGSAAVLGGGLPPQGLRGTGRPVFAETEMLLVMAGGGEMQKVDLSTFDSSRLGGSPPLASHVIAQSLRLLANDLNDDRTKVRYSDIASGFVTYAGHESWLPSSTSDAGFFTAEARPDPVLALAENTNTVFAFGQTTLELFVADPTYRFARSAATEDGCGAIYSPVKVEQDLLWIDNQSRVLMGSDQGVKIISQPIQSTLDAMFVGDAFGMRFVVGPCDCVAWKFPTDGRTFVYQDTLGWSQWSGWDGASLVPFKANCSDDYTCKTVGTSDGYVGELSLDALDDMGVGFKAYIQTGFQDHGTSAVKDCRRVQLTLKRGTSTSGSEPVCSLKWRDRPGPWGEPIRIRLGATGDTFPVVDLSGLGTYRTREWAFEFTGTGELSLVSAEETFVVTES